LAKEYRQLKARNATQNTRHEDLLVRHEELKDLYHKTDSKLKALETLHDGNQEEYIKGLQAQIDENENLIANQEQQLEDHRVSKERQERELNSLRPQALRVRELEDNYKVLKNENESLVKKANMVDHFQEKLKDHTDVYRENASLRDHIDVLNGNLKHYDKVNTENEKLRNTQKEYEKKFSDYEAEANSLSNECSMYKADAREKDKQIEALKTRQAADERFIQDLQEQIKTGNTGPYTPHSPSGGRENLTLEEELANAPEPTPNYPLEISRLQAEIQLLRSGSGGTTNATLQTDLEESERARKRLEENLRDLTENQAITIKQLEAVLATSSNEKYVQAVDLALKSGPFKILMEDFYRDNAIARTRNMERKATEELKVTKAKLADVQFELTSQTRDLLAAKAECKLSFNSKYYLLTLTQIQWLQSIKMKLMLLKI
jgi:protein HOOK3